MKTVLITGASAGFGKRVAEKLLDRDYTVYAGARRVERMEDLAERGAHTFHLDVTDGDSVAHGVQRMMAEQGRIDILLNNAGYGSYGIVECVPMEEIQYQFDVNVFGMARVLKAVLPHMREARAGRILNVASVVGHVSTPVLGWYASTKFAVEGMTDALRVEVRPIGIDVVLIEPGAVKTGFDEVAFAKLEAVEHPDDYKAMVAKFRDFAQGMYQKCQGPEKTAGIIVKAMEADRPKIRYRTTFDARLLPVVKRMMGARLFDWGLSRQLR